MGSNDEFTYAMQLVSSTSLNVVLVNAIKLKVLEAIAHSGPNALLSASEIASSLAISNKEAPNMLDRMLRLLASHSIVTCTQRENDTSLVRVYGLAPVAKYFIPNEDGVSLGAFMELLHDKVIVDASFKFKDSVLEGGVPFDNAFGTHVFEYAALDARFGDVFNKAMMNHTSIVIKEILECYHGFQNLKQLVDVGGGIGVALNMIVSKHPTIKGINFDLPHVTRDAPLYHGIKHVGGDMFQEVPQGDAIFLKWILHDWNDGQCVKLLMNCYKALPYDGKVIVVEAVVPFLPDTSSYVKVPTAMDVGMMMHNLGGKERTFDEFSALAKDAGFSGVRKECFVCNLWIMEFYK